MKQNTELKNQNTDLYFVFCILFLASCSCENKREVSSPLSPLITKSVLTSSKEGKKTWRISCERIKIMNGKTYLYNLELLLYKDDAIQCTITGDKAMIQGDKIAISGNIIARTNREETLTTSSLIFDEKTNSLRSDGEISFIKNGLVLKGLGFVADRSLKDIRIKNGVYVFWTK